MTAWNPHTLWDAGFQLSFAATLGLVLYTGPLERGFERALARVASAERAHKVVSLINEALIVTLAAQITTTPLILHTFGRLSLVTLVTNFLILPAQPGVMVWGGLALLVGLVVQPLGQAIGWVAWVFLTYTIEVVRLTARVPFASLPVRVSGWMVWGYYVLLGGLTWWLAQPRERRCELWEMVKKPGFSRKTRFLGTLEPKLLAGAAVVLAALAFFAWRSLPDGRLHVVFFDVGQGDAILIQTPSGRQVLVDGGPTGTTLLSQLGHRMPFWDRTLDLVVLTHPDSDHLTGLLPVLERYAVGSIICRQIELESEPYEYWLRLLEQEGAAVYRGEAGLRVTLDDADAARPVEMVVLHPGVELVSGEEGTANVIPSAARNLNDISVVTRLTYGQVSVLLPGDIEAVVEHRLVGGGAPLRSTVLKAAHHGSCGSTTPEFLGAVDPQAVVISVGADNDFGHPCDGVLGRLEGRGVPVYRTDERGTVEVVSDGTQVWVETER
jgi:competence protein ComEC